MRDGRLAVPSNTAAARLYLRDSAVTAPGRYRAMLAGLPCGTAALAVVVQGLLIHERHTALYGAAARHGWRASAAAAGSATPGTWSSPALFPSSQPHS
jgi:hypothetical protein